MNNLWTEAWAKETEGIDLTNARVGGCATKANPNKEDAAWWNQAGPVWVENYISWRKENPNWKIWTAPDGNKGIELSLNPIVKDGFAACEAADIMSFVKWLRWPIRGPARD